jgi:uncharacterized membrane protein YeaQ/YmgE (transglycosylase-associated protein family)
MDFLCYLGVWLLCGFVAAAIYQRKGRSGLAAFIVGVLLGPIGVILALLSSTNQEGVEEKQLKNGEMKKCPHCAELIKMDANVCRYCGRDV